MIKRVWKRWFIFTLAGLVGAFMVTFPCDKVVQCKDPVYAPFPNRIDIKYGGPHDGKPLPEGPFEKLLRAKRYMDAGKRLLAMSGALDKLIKAKDRSITGNAFKEFLYAAGGCEDFCQEIERSAKGWINVVDRLSQRSREIEKAVQEYTGEDPRGEAECKAVRWSAAKTAVDLMKLNDSLSGSNSGECSPELIDTIREVQSNLRALIPEIKNKCARALLPKDQLVPPEVERALSIEIAECEDCEEQCRQKFLDCCSSRARCTSGECQVSNTKCMDRCKQASRGR